MSFRTKLYRHTIYYQLKHDQLHRSLGLDYAPILYGLTYIQLETEVVNIVESEKSASRGFLFAVECDQ